MGVLKEMVEGDMTLLVVRVSKGNKFGYSTTSNLDNWEHCLKNAVKVMRVSKPLKNKIQVSEKSKTKRPEGLLSKKVKNLPPENLVSMGDKMISSAKRLKKDIVIPNAYLSKVFGKYHFMNSNGVESKEGFTLFSGTSQVIHGVASGVNTFTSHDLIKTSELGKSSAQMCLDGLNPKQVRTMKADLILDYFAFSSLIASVLVPSLEGDNVLNKRSYLQDKLNQKVFSDKLSVSDNGILSGGLYSSAIDAEGTPRQTTTLIEDGIVKNFLYDQYSAKLSKAKSTGNCMGLEKVPSVGPSNFIVQPGDYKREEIIEETRRGIYTHFLAGTHAINETSGDVSVGLENAFYIKDGKIEHPVKQALVSFNLFDALKKLQVVGKDLRQESSVACPIVRLDNVQVIG